MTTEKSTQEQSKNLARFSSACLMICTTWGGRRRSSRQRRPRHPRLRSEGLQPESAAQSRLDQYRRRQDARHDRYEELSSNPVTDVLFISG